MTETLRTVPVGEMIASANPDDVLVVYGLGSCVAVCLYDPLAQVGGMLHALLPTPIGNNGAGGIPTKFVDQGVPFLIDSLEALGANPSHLVTQLCGGAQMITAPGDNDFLNIGERNVRTAKKALRARGLKIQARSTGGHSGRTVKLYLANGQVTARTLGQEEQVLIKSPMELEGQGGLRGARPFIFRALGE